MHRINAKRPRLPAETTPLRRYYHYLLRYTSYESTSYALATIMMRTPEKSNSVPDVSKLDNVSPPNYVAARNKRKRSTEVSLSQIQDMTMELKSEMNELINKLAETQSTQINTILSTLKDIQQTNNMLQTTLTHLTEENSELRAKIEKFEIQEKKDREQIILLESKLEEIQRGERKTNIEIKNIPLTGSENKKDLLQLVSKLSETLQVKFEKTEIKDIIKVKKQNQEKTSLIVEFTNTYIKTEMIKSAKQFNYKNKTSKLSARHLGLKTHADTPIFVSENLTPLASRLYFLARDFKQANNYKYCWTNYGKVYLRCNDETPIINITREAQIQQLIKK